MRIIVVLIAVASAGATEAVTLAGKRFPTLAVTSLAGSLVTLPDAGRGKVLLIAFGLTRESNSQITAWFDSVRVETADTTRHDHYTVPLMGNGFAKRISGFINMSMRRGLPPGELRRTLPWYADYRPYAELLGMTDRTRAYLFLVDQSGTIRWTGSGLPITSSLASLRVAIRSL